MRIMPPQSITCYEYSEDRTTADRGKDGDGRSLSERISKMNEISGELGLAVESLEAEEISTPR